MKNVLIFAEDPGAANYMRDFPQFLKEMGLNPIIYSVSFANKILTNNIDNTFEEIENVYLRAELLLEKINPQLLIVGTSENLDTFSFKLTSVAKEKNIPSLAMVDSVANVKSRFKGYSDSPLTHITDYLLVPDEETKNEFKKIGFDYSNIYIYKNPHFNTLLEKRKPWSKFRFIELSKKKFYPKLEKIRPVIVFVSEISTGLNEKQYQKSNNYTLFGSKKSVLRTEVVLDELFLALNNSTLNPYMVLRLHPKQNRQNLSKYLSKFDYISKDEDGLLIVNSADLVVGMTSVLLKEAAIIGKPVLSIVPKPDEELWLGDMKNIIKCLSTRKQVNDFLQSKDNWKNIPVRKLSKLSNNKSLLKKNIKSILNFNLNYKL